MSSSRSSCSSVKNPYNNNNSIMSRKKYNSDFEYRFSGIKCKCDLASPCQEAWKEGTMDPGRRFFGCSQYLNPSKKCNFFLWADPPYPERAREVINYLKEKIRGKDEELQRAMIELSFVEKKMLVLDEECMALRKRNDEVEAILQKEKQSKKLKKLLVIVVIAWIVFNLFM